MLDKIITVRLAEPIVRALKYYAQQNEVTVGTLIRRAVRELVERLSQEPPKNGKLPG